MKKKLKISGMHCPACKALIEDVCGDFDAITSATVDVKKEVLVIECGDSFDLTELKTELESTGPYKVTL